MVKKIILIFNLIAIFLFAQDWRTRQYIHAVVADSAGTMRGTVSDTADVVRTEYGSGDNTVKSVIRDTATVVWTDSVSTVRGEIRDTSTIVWNDSASIVRGEIRDTSTTVWNDSIAKFRDRAVIDTALIDSINTEHIVINKILETKSIIDMTTSTTIDSFKLNGASDTLFFFIGGVKFAAVKP